MFCLHIYLNFLLKARWTHNLFYFLSIFKSLQVKIQAFLVHKLCQFPSFNILLLYQIIDWNDNYESSKTLITSNKQLCIAEFFQEPILKIWLQIVVKAGAINFDALHQLLYLLRLLCHRLGMAVVTNVQWAVTPAEWNQINISRKLELLLM